MNHSQDNPEQGWQASAMTCNCCGHRWASVHPVEAEYLECPSCHNIASNPAPFVQPDGSVNWPTPPKTEDPHPFPVHAWALLVASLLLACVATYIVWLVIGGR